MNEPLRNAARFVSQPVETRTFSRKIRVSTNFCMFVSLRLNRINEKLTKHVEKPKQSGLTAICAAGLVQQFLIEPIFQFLETSSTGHRLPEY